MSEPRTTRRTARTDPAATPLMDAARRRAGQPSAEDVRSGRAPIPDAQAARAVPLPAGGVVPAQALQEMHEAIIERIQAGEQLLARRLAELGAQVSVSSIDVETRAQALKLARDHVRRTTAPLSDASAEARLEAEMRVASFLLGESRGPVGR